MNKPKTLEENFKSCIEKGFLIPVDEDETDKAETLLFSAKEDLQVVEEQKESGRFSTLYKLTYDVIHSLTEALLCFDRVKSTNHQCLFAFLCYKHPELELDWNFFEKIRTKRNNLKYEGKPITLKDWKEISLQADLYIKLLIREVKKRIEKKS